jgi:DNA polymerase III epsilon subunit-like protein
MDNDHVWHGCVSSKAARAWDDGQILAKLNRLMLSADIIAGHNVDAYDMKRCNTRFLKHGLEPVTGKRTFDTLKIARQKFAFESNRLDYISQELGFRPKDDITNDDWNRIVMTGDAATLKKVDTYCMGDVREGKKVLRSLMKYSGKKRDYGSYKVGE